MKLRHGIIFFIIGFLLGVTFTATALIGEERAPVVLRGRDKPPTFEGPICSPALAAGTPCAWTPLPICGITTNAGTPCIFQTPTAQDHNQCVETWVFRSDEGGNFIDQRRVRVCVDSGDLKGYRGFGWDVFLVVAEDGSEACGSALDAGYFSSGNVQVECPYREEK